MAVHRDVRDAAPIQSPGWTVHSETNDSGPGVDSPSSTSASEGFLGVGSDISFLRFSQSRYDFLRVIGELCKSLNFDRLWISKRMGSDSKVTAFRNFSSFASDNNSNLIIQNLGHVTDVGFLDEVTRLFPVRSAHHASPFQEIAFARPQLGFWLTLPHQPLRSSHGTTSPTQSKKYCLNPFLRKEIPIVVFWCSYC